MENDFPVTELLSPRRPRLRVGAIARAAVLKIRGMHLPPSSLLVFFTLLSSVRAQSVAFDIYVPRDDGIWHPLRVEWLSNLDEQWRASGGDRPLHERERQMLAQLGPTLDLAAHRGSQTFVLTNSILAAASMSDILIAQILVHLPSKVMLQFVAGPRHTLDEREARSAIGAFIVRHAGMQDDYPDAAEILFTHLLDSYDSIDPALAPPDHLNTDIYDTFLHQVRRAVEDEAAFATFKSSRTESLYKVFFSFWNLPQLEKSMERALVCVHERSPHLLVHLPFLAAADRSIGAPVTRTFALPQPTTPLPDATTRPALPPSVEASTVVVRYLFELSLLEQGFGGPVSGLHILEIGGGYGGMAATIATAYGRDVASHTIVDLDVVGALISKYAERLGTHTIRHISPTDETHINSDLLISFFCLSEQKKWVVDDYAAKYIAHAKRGYVQLNYDEDLSRGGRPFEVDASGYTEEATYNLLEIFKIVYDLQPTAIMLPPPPCGVHSHHRIKWGPPIEPLPI